MATNITGVTITRPLTDPAIAPSGTFIIGGQITKSGGGAWAESGDIYAEWDQGTGSWTTIGSSGALNVAAATNPITGLQTDVEQTWTVYSDGTEGTFQVRIKLIEDDLTTYTTAATTVTVSAGATTYTQTASIDGYLQKGQTKTPALDAALTKADQTKTVGADGYLQQTKYIYIGSP